MPQTKLLVFQDVTGTVPLQDWLDELERIEPKAYVKCLARIQQLERLGSELRRPAADILRDEVYELRTKAGRVHYRILYFFCGKNMACLSHGFTKKGEVPDAEIDRGVRAKRLVKTDPDRYTVEWEL
jgi:phage-related protein